MSHFTSGGRRRTPDTPHGARASSKWPNHRPEALRADRAGQLPGVHARERDATDDTGITGDAFCEIPKVGVELCRQGCG
ncbi:hypothetical protein [Streptomyces sp. H39-S7]|uniref:hypothetical protein n=1 Tax=Streptomyces sp. H39-S7 TaxID=3004357 RepID=UPI0022AEE583|nr:hypothetical protein [Streptomyces sp. H39-S7]MCZ4124031.1 hypothetical protein [Streptomyces sp. H39-S7]